MERCMNSRRTISTRVFSIALVSGCFFGLAFVLRKKNGLPAKSIFHNPLHIKDNGGETQAGYVPQELFQMNVYAPRDFEETKRRRSPAFWSCQDSRDSCNRTDLWGPCFAPQQRKHTDWTKQVELARLNNHTAIYHDKNDNYKDKDNLAGYCKPGFLIIGAGKCGTSSLYHYLTAHPRVLPAVEKQIHYFKYYYDYPVKWYLRHFPTATSFLANGALLTGEASPGYLPYPDVVNRVRTTMAASRIIVVGRNPLERAYSSYKYNYVDPTMEEMYKGRVPKVHAAINNESYYQQFLFSFQDLIEAELKQLRKCMDPAGGGGGDAIVKARDSWSRYAWVRDEVQRRQENGLPPLVDLDGFCYGQGNSSVPRAQWAELMAKHPTKVITSRNLHLKQAMIGRSLYFAPLEWWYAGLSKENIFFLCTEELKDFSGIPLRKLSRFLGLPDYNFSAVLREGAFNVGGHRGYDEEVSWDVVSNSAAEAERDTIPLTDALRTELLEFIEPYNERLFRLVGRRCKWS